MAPMIYNFSLLLLLLTIPLFPSTPYAGVPLWAWVSIAMTVLYAGVLIYHIQNSWDTDDNG